MEEGHSRILKIIVGQECYLEALQEGGMGSISRVCADAPSRSTTGDLRGPICSVVDSSMSVHSKASGNFQLLTGSEGGDTKRLGGSQY